MMTSDNQPPRSCDPYVKNLQREHERLQQLLSEANAEVTALRAERTHLETELRYIRFVVDNAPDMMDYVDEDGYYRYVNNAACDVLGYSRSELLTMRVSDIDPTITPENWTQAGRSKKGAVRSPLRANNAVEMAQPSQWK